LIAAVHRAPGCLGLRIATALSAAILVAASWLLTRIVPDGVPWPGFRILRALRLFGNGGLFSISGLFWNRSLGRFRAFANDPVRAIVLVLSDRKIVVTPEHQDAFLSDLRRLHPQLAHST
jgi:hypothetical protein